MDVQELRRLKPELTLFLERYAPLFGRDEAHDHANRFVHGLLLGGNRRSVENIAEAIDGCVVRSQQKFIAQSPWPDAELWEELQRHVTEVLGDPDATLNVDETGFPKKGTQSVGVKRPYAGWASLPPARLKEVDLLASDASTAEEAVTQMQKNLDAQVTGKKKVRQRRTYAKSYRLEQRLFRLAFVRRTEMLKEWLHPKRPPDDDQSGLIGPLAVRPAVFPSRRRSGSTPIIHSPRPGSGSCKPGSIIRWSVSICTTISACLPPNADKLMSLPQMRMIVEGNRQDHGAGSRTSIQTMWIRAIVKKCCLSPSKGRPRDNVERLVYANCG